jgi:hypothetical protein
MFGSTAAGVSTHCSGVRHGNTTTSTSSSMRCLSPEVQVLVHSGYELTQKDHRELYLLRERFGVEPPPALLDNVLAVAPGEDET